MKDVIQEAYRDILTQNLEEGKIKDALGAIAVAGAIATGVGALKDSPKNPETSGVVQPAQTADKEKLLDTVKSKFSVDHEKASHIVDMAIKYSKPVFPQAHHILSIAGIESSFNEKAKSKLKFDPAVGLMQIRPKTWGIGASELSSIEGQIKHGSHILHHYYNKTGSVESAVKAYNIGLTNFNKGKQQDAAHRYVTKFKNEVSRYHSVLGNE